MTTYKHTPPNKPEEVEWFHIKDWWSLELGANWDSTMKYHILKVYNEKFFPEFQKSLEQPEQPKKPIRYLNRV